MAIAGSEERRRVEIWQEINPAAVETWRKLSEDELSKRIEIRDGLRAIGIEEDVLQNWDMLNIKGVTLEKFVPPKLEDIQKWRALPKTPEALQVLKHPVLCKWSLDEIIEALAPVVGSHVRKFHTTLTDEFDCKQNGALGILDAIRTDAGKAPFWDHAFLWAKTKVRRASAIASGDTEKRPSRTEVREVITHWLEGTLVEYEMDKRAADTSNALKEAIGVKRSVFNNRYESYADVEQTLDTAEEWLAAVGNDKELNIKAVVAVITKQLADIVEAAEAAVERAVGAGFKINTQCLLDTTTKTVEKKERPRRNRGSEETEARTYEVLEGPDLIETRVQKTGRRCTKLLVKDSFRLERLSLEQRMDLLDFLNWKFNPNAESKGNYSIQISQDGSKREKKTWVTSRHIFQSLDSQKHRTIGDLVNIVACAPDFHGRQTVPWSVPMDDGSSKDDSIGNEVSWARIDDSGLLVRRVSPQFSNPTQRAEHEELRLKTSQWIDVVRSRVPLTHEQETVLFWSWGLEGFTQKTGTFIANNYSKLLLVNAIRKLVRDSKMVDSDQLAILKETLDTVISKPDHDQGLNIKRSKPFDAVAFKQHISNEAKGFIDEMRSRNRAEAQRFGALWSQIKKLIDENELNGISRQRVTQYQETLEKKVREELFAIYFLNRPNSKQLLEKALQAVELTDEEKDIAKFSWGLHGERAAPIEELVRDFDAICEWAKPLDQKVRREQLQEMQRVIKNKLLDTSL